MSCLSKRSGVVYGTTPGFMLPIACLYKDWVFDFSFLFHELAGRVVPLGRNDESRAAYLKLEFSCQLYLRFT